MYTKRWIWILLSKIGKFTIGKQKSSQSCHTFLNSIDICEYHWDKIEKLAIPPLFQSWAPLVLNVHFVVFSDTKLFFFWFWKRIQEIQITIWNNGRNSFTTISVCCCLGKFYSFEGSSWSWSYGSWIYNYFCNQRLSPLTLWVRILPIRGVLDATLCDKVCQWLATGRWFPPPIKLTAMI